MSRLTTKLHGFTLVEVVITVALFAIVMLGTAQLYIMYGRVITSQKSAITAGLGGSSIIDATREGARQASHVVATHLFSGISYNSGTTTAIFELPSYDASGTVIANTYDYIGISASSTNVYRLVDAAAGSSRISGQKQLSAALDALSFTYDAPTFPLVTNVIVDATTSASVQGQTTRTHRQGHFYLQKL